MPIFTALFWAKAGKKAKGLVTSPWFWAVLVLVAVAGGTAYYLHTDKKEAVAAATKNGDQRATTKSLEADSEVTRRVADREQPLIILREQTIKDYANVRATLEAQPQAERDAPAPRVIIDTLNQLDRLRAAREPTPVPDPEIPVG